MVGGGDYLPLLRKIAVLELKTWDSERVPSCAAPHCLRVLWVLDLFAALETGSLELIWFPRAMGRPKVLRLSSIVF